MISPPEQAPAPVPRRAAWRDALRRPWSWLVVALVVVAVAVPAAALVPADEAGARTLIVLSGDDEGQGSPRQVLLDLWNAAHPESPARFAQPAGTISDAQHSLMKRFVDPDNAGDEEYDVDVLNLDVPWIHEFAQRGHIVPLDAGSLPVGLLDGLLDNPRRSGYDEQGTLWALPFHADAGLLYYRKEPLGLDGARTLDRPPSWDDLTARSRAAMVKDRTIEAGYAGQLAGYEGLTVNFLETLWAVERPGGSDNALGLPTDPQTWKTAVERLYDTRPGGVVLSDSRTFRERDTTAAFEAGKVVFMRNWPLAYRELLTDDGARAAAQYGVTALPGPSVVGGQSLAVARKSRQPEAAQELVEFLASRPAQRLLMQLGGFAATWRDVYDDPDIQQLYPHAPTIRDSIERARMRPLTRDYPFFSQTVRDLVDEIHRTGTVPADLADRLRAALDGKFLPTPAPS